ncbi:phosphotransferase family protein [Streptomyces sp. S1D4-11]|nr:phosphotransferase family protein [Streptomyces sp. S1D4-11]QIZ01076.1 phosphotransferase family protein [Streptomyces sp. S1D4-11]
MSAAVEYVADGLDPAALTKFFDDRVAGFRGGLSAELMQGGRSNLTYRLTDGHTSWVLRRPPPGALTPSAHDMRREYRVVSALTGSGVPVARPVAFGDESVMGVPFSVVEHVEGMVIHTLEQLNRLPQESITECGYTLVDVLASLHAIDPDAVGLTGFGRPEGYLSRQIERGYDQWGRVRTRRLPDIEALSGRLAVACPPESGASIVHGDFRIDNAIVSPDDPTDVRALVDWEMATLGDPLADLGLHLAYADPAFAPVLAGSAASTSNRLPAPSQLADRYASVSGRDLGNLDFYLSLGYFKIAVIAEGIHARHRRGLTLGSGFDTVGQAVAPLAAAGLRAPGSSV